MRTVRFALLVWLGLLPSLTLAAASATPTQEGALIPIPRQKPKDLVPPAGITAAPKWQKDDGKWSAAAVSEARSACSALLAGKDIAYIPQAPIGAEGGCGAPAPIEITAIAGVSLDPPAVTSCAMAAGLHAWITGTVQPAARRRLDTQVTGIRTASSYVCRLRNNARNGKLSEHGRANALDISGFTFAKSKDVTVDDGWGGFLHKIGFAKQGGFLGEIREGACQHFATVLGPGSDAYHGDHFHVDAMQRKNGWRICK